MKTSCGFDIKIKDSFQEIDAVSVSSNRFSSIFTSWNNLIQAILRWFK